MGERVASSLTSAAAVEGYLGVAFDESQVEQATALLPAADAAIQRYTDRAWLSPAIAGEVYTADGPILLLRQRPIVSVERVQAGWYMAPLVLLTAGSQYAIRDAGRGMLLLSPWWASRPNDRSYATIVCDYTPLATVPADVALAATMLVAAWLQPALTGDGNDTAPGAVMRTRVGDVEEQYGVSAAPTAAGSLPPGVVALLAPYRSALSFA